jgi:prolyl-tRNA synthetase
VQSVFQFCGVKRRGKHNAKLCKDIYPMSEQLTPRAENYSQWYQDLVIKADLAENSAVRGCMVIKPYGYAIWERMQQDLDRRFKETGTRPMLISRSSSQNHFSRRKRATWKALLRNVPS